MTIVMTVVTSPHTSLTSGRLSFNGEKQAKHIYVVGNKDNGVGNSYDNSDDGGYKHLTHLSQVVDCHLTERSKQNTSVDGN